QVAGGLPLPPARARGRAEDPARQRPAPARPLMPMDDSFDSAGLTLAAHVARPARAAAGPLPALVLCHGFPAGPGGAATSAQTYPVLADRLAADTGWTVLVFTFRGAGGSAGNFSLAGWRDDIVAAVDKLSADPVVRGVWLAGSSTGGALA